MFLICFEKISIIVPIIVSFDLINTRTIKIFTQSTCNHLQFVDVYFTYHHALFPTGKWRQNDSNYYNLNIRHNCE